MAVAKEQFLQIISENNINSVADVYALQKEMLVKWKNRPLLGGNFLLLNMLKARIPAGFP